MKLRYLNRSSGLAQALGIVVCVLLGAPSSVAASEGHAHGGGLGAAIEPHSNPTGGAGDDAPFPTRADRPLVPAYQGLPHRTVATSCDEPGPLVRVAVEAGRTFARPGEVFGFNPRVVKVEPCAEVEVTYRNTDDIRHTFMLPGLSPMPNVEISGKGSKTVRFTAPAEDIALAYHCHVARHEKMGMVGWLIVGEGGLPERQPVEPTAEVHYEVAADIISVDRRRSMIIADHQEIPNVMAAMTMGFPVADQALLEGLEEGVRVRLRLRELDMVVTEISVLDGEVAEVSPDTAERPESEASGAETGGVVTFEAEVVAKLLGRGELLVDHEDIPGHMPAMTMAFKLRNPGLFEKVAEGERVRFRLDTGANEIVGLAEGPAEVAPNHPPSEIVRTPAGISSEAVTLGADLDGDGDPDEVDIRLEVIELQQEVWPGKFLTAWVFAPVGAGMTQAARLPSPVIRVEQGDRLRVHLENTHYLPHTIHPHGTLHPNAVDGVPMVTQHAVMPGEVFVTEFTAKNPGSHFYHCHVQPDVHVPMGLAGMLVIEENRPDNHFSHLVVGAGEMPDMSKATAESYDREYVLVYADADDRMNRIPVEARDAGTVDRRMHREFDTTQYKPNVFLLNGRSFPFTLRDTPILVREGERVKLRILNAGSRVISLHPHGHRVRVTHKDGHPVDPGAETVRDVLTITAAQRLDVELIADPDTVYSSGPGVWLMHDHSEHAATNDGYSPGGDITAIVYEDTHWDARTALPRTVDPLDRFFDPAYYTGDLPTFPSDLFASAPAVVEGSIREGVGHVIGMSSVEGTVTIDRDPSGGLSAGIGVYPVWDDSVTALAEVGARVRFTLDLDSGEILLLEAMQ